MLVHGLSPDSMILGTMVPIPKNKRNTNIIIHISARTYWYLTVTHISYHPINYAHIEPALAYNICPTFIIHANIKSLTNLLLILCICLTTHPTILICKCLIYLSQMLRYLDILFHPPIKSMKPYMDP